MNSYYEGFTRTRENDIRRGIVSSRSADCLEVGQRSWLRSRMGSGLIGLGRMLLGEELSSELDRAA